MLLIQKLEQSEEQTIPLSELKDDVAVSDPNGSNNDIEISSQTTVPPDYHDTGEDLSSNHSNGFEMGKGETPLAVTKADLVELEENKQPRKMEDFQEQVTECNGNSYEEVTNLRQQLQQNHLALSESGKLVAELRESLSGAEQRAEQLALELAEGLFL